VINSMKTTKVRKIDKFNKALYFIIVCILTYVFIKAGFVYHVKQTISGYMLLMLKCVLAMELNAILHECVHALTGKLVIPDARFKMAFGFNKAQTKRIGGDPTRIQDQIYTIMPFVILSVVGFFIGLAVNDKTDFVMLMVIFNTAGCVLDIEMFLNWFCFPKDMPLSQMSMSIVEHKNWYCKFWARWDRFFAN